MKTNVFKKVTSMAVASALVATMGISAFAADATDTSIGLTKSLSIAQGLTAANSFTFQFESTSAGAPDIADITLDFNGMKDTDKDGVITQTAILDLADQDWTTAGIFEYTVTEKNDGAAGVTYDAQAYTLKVGVKNNGAGGYVVTDVVVQDGTDGTGAKVLTDGNGDDLTDDQGVVKTEENGDDQVASPMAWGNTYIKIADSTDTGIEDDPTTEETENKASLVISNETTGEYGDEELPFDFDISFDFSKTNVDEDDLDVHVYKADENNNLTEITPNEDGSYSVELADGEKMIVEGLPIGTTYDITEKIAGDDVTEKYTPSADVVEDGVADPTVTGKQGEDLTLEDKLIGENENSVDFDTENTDDDISPTGVIIQNAPYILLGVIAAGGLTGYVYKRRRVEE